MKSMIERLQPLGRALMLPIAVLPAAGLLLRLGQPDLLNIAFLSAAGDALFSHLGLLFAVGVSVGFAKDGNGAAGLAGVVCFLIVQRVAESFIIVPTSALQGYANDVVGTATDAFRAASINKIDVPIGIISGLTAGSFYNRFSQTVLPDYLAFFGGRRLVPIVSGVAGLAIGAVLGVSYGWIDAGIDAASRSIVSTGSLGLFVYGMLNRLLLVTGLHHIINNVVWFVIGDYHGTTGDLRRFFAGDPTAGNFMSGFFPIMMFGLPGACLAMYRQALPDRRQAVSGMLLSLALTSFLTGVTEPIEFTFMFVAPPLYAIHAVLTGASMALMAALHVHLGFGFSAGLFDYVLNFGKSTRPLLLIPVGLAYFAIYYGLFSIVIRRFDLKTPGRDEVPQATVSAISDRGSAFVEALGGAANLTSVDACTTRLRLRVVDTEALERDHLKALGARGVLTPSNNSAQVVLGPIADMVAMEIREALAGAGAVAEPDSASPPAEIRNSMPVKALPAQLVAALGGPDSIHRIDALHGRLRVELAGPSHIETATLDAVAPRGSAIVNDTVVHILVD